jgi:hypothetical protein
MKPNKNSQDSADKALNLLLEVMDVWKDVKHHGLRMNLLGAMEHIMLAMKEPLIPCFACEYVSTKRCPHMGHAADCPLDR